MCFSLIKYILFAVEENAFLSHSSLRQVPVQNLLLVGLDFPLAAVVSNARKRKMLTYTQEI
jgi:hypothetical protein